MEIKDKIALITGSTSGIGKATALNFASAGATVIIVGRYKTSVQATASEIKRISGNERVQGMLADLSSQQSIRNLAQDFKAKHRKLDILIHCAAVFNSIRSTTVDGLETMFATNYLAAFLLTHLLLDQLKKSKARIIIVTAPSTVKPDLDDLQGLKKFSAITAFGATKAEDLLFTFELAKNVHGSGITVNAYHPGIVKGTNLMRQAPIPIKIVSGVLNSIIGITPKQAAQGLVELASSITFDNVSGQLIHKGKPMKAPFQNDTDTQKRLWVYSVKLARLK